MRTEQEQKDPAREGTTTHGVKPARLGAGDQSALTAQTWSGAPCSRRSNEKGGPKAAELRNLQGIRFTLRLATQEAPLGSPPRSQGVVAASKGRPER
jgi:hypothetical protein